MEGFKDFDPAEYIQGDEDIFYTIKAAFEEDPGDGSLIRSALNDIARAQGMSTLAQNTGLGRESLYKTLSSKGNPSFQTMQKILRAFGLGLKPVKLN